MTESRSKHRFCLVKVNDAFRYYMPEDLSSMYTNPAFSLKLEKPENFSLLAQILLSYRKKPMGGQFDPPSGQIGLKP